MNDHWSTGWSSNHEAVPIPIPTGAMSPNNFASPRSESYGGGSICRQVVENILSGSPATPKAPDPFRIADNFLAIKTNQMTNGVLSHPPRQHTEPAPHLFMPGTPEFQPFLNSMTAAGMPPPQWNSMLASASNTNAQQQQHSQHHQPLSPILPMTPATDVSSPSLFSTSPPVHPAFSREQLANGPTLSKAMALQAAQQQMTLQNLMSNPQIQVLLATQQLINMNQPILYPPQQPLASQMQAQMQALYIHQQMNQVNANPNLMSLQSGLISPIAQNTQNPFILNPMSNANRTTRQQPRNLMGDPISPPLPKHSLILEEIKTNRNPALSLRDVGQYISEFARDQHGSRFIQQKLERADPGEMNIVYEAIIKDGVQLMTDVFGNYVVQKFFENASDDQRAGLCNLLRGNILQLSLQMYGCRVIQKAIETCVEPLQMEIINEIRGQVLKCIEDQNGNHVMQKIIERVQPASKLQFIVDAIINERENRVIALAKHMYGCRVIQRVLEHCSEEQKGPIVKTIYRAIETLMNDQYGNYVIQHLVEHGTEDDRDVIISSIVGKVFILSQRKFSSNVIERILQFASAQHRNRLITEVCMNDPNDPNPPLMIMMKDQFANYVVQKMLEVADSVHRKKMLNSIKPHMPQLRKVNYGKQLIAKLEKYFQKPNYISGPLDSPQPLQHQMTF